MKTQPFPFAFFGGKIVSLEDAKVSIMTNALQYGTGLFSGIRGYYSAKEKAVSVFRIGDHYARMLSSIGILGVGFPFNKEELIDFTIDLIKKNKPDRDVYFRPFAYAGHTGLGPNLADTTFDFAMYMIPLGEYLPVDTGLSVMVSSWRRISDSMIPARAKITGGYINSALARKEANDYGFDEAIMLTDDGHVSEGTGENIFIVRNNTLITPAVSDDILEGISRRSVLQIAKDMGIAVEERSIDRSELYVADEAFFTGTACQVAWIGAIDKRVVGDGKIGPVSKKLQEKFFKVVRGEDEEYAGWRTKVGVK